MIKFLILLLLSFNAYALPEYEASEHLTAITLPTHAKCGSGDAEVQIIDEVADWSTIDDVGKTIFCVQPGDYNNDVFITRSGSSGSERYLIYYDPADDNSTHPVNMAEADRARVNELRWDNSPATSYWIVDRITVKGTGDSSVWIIPGNNNIILNRMLVENSGGSGQVSGGGDNNVLQNSVVRNSNLTGGDDHCVSFYGDNFKVVGNELYNCTGDMIQISNASTGGIIADNEMYVTSAYYTDCAGSIDSSGNCMAVENALDFKGGADKANSFPFGSGEPLLVTGNVMWGFNRDDDTAFVTGASNKGVAVIVHGGTAGSDPEAGEGVIFEDNIITSTAGSSVSTNIDSVGIIGANSVNRHYTYKNNLFYDMNYALSLPSNKTDKHEFYYNTFLDTAQTAFSIGNYDNNDFMCNVFITGTDNGFTAQGSGDLWDYNAYYDFDDTDITNTNDLTRDTAAEALNGDVTFTRHFITNPTTVTVTNAETTASSPHASSFCDDPTETATRGVDNVDQLTRTQAGFNLSGFSSEEPLPPSGMEMMQMGETEKPIVVTHVHTFGCVVDKLKAILKVAAE